MGAEIPHACEQQPGLPSQWDHCSQPLRPSSPRPHGQLSLKQNGLRLAFVADATQNRSNRTSRNKKIHKNDKIWSSIRFILDLKPAYSLCREGNIIEKKGFHPYKWDRVDHTHARELTFKLASSITARSTGHEFCWRCRQRGKTKARWVNGSLLLDIGVGIGVPPASMWN